LNLGKTLLKFSARLPKRRAALSLVPDVEAQAQIPPDELAQEELERETSSDAEETPRRVEDDDEDD
jgi:hypothetical protein